MNHLKVTFFNYSENLCKQLLVLNFIYLHLGRLIKSFKQIT